MGVIISKTSLRLAVNCNQSREASCFFVMGGVGLKFGCWVAGFLSWRNLPYKTEAEHQCGWALRATGDLMMTQEKSQPSSDSPCVPDCSDRQMSVWLSPILEAISPLALETRSLNCAHSWLCDPGPVTHPLWASASWLDYISSSQPPFFAHVDIGEGLVCHKWVLLTKVPNLANVLFLNIN